MNFLFPQFLFGFIALSIPVIVHLFNFRKTKKIQFSSNLFLQKIKEVSTAKRKLKHYLILASRLLFLSFLVLAFAQPYLPGMKESLKNDVVYIYLDNSFSMSNQIATDLSAFDDAINFVDELLEVYPQNTRYKLLTNEFNTSGDILKTKDEIRELISEISLSGISRTMDEVNNRLSRNLADYNIESKDIYWLSDFQQSTIGPMQDILVDTSAAYYLVPMEYIAPNNVYIDTLYLTNPFLLENEKNNLVISFKNIDNESISDLPVKFFLNEIQVANTSISIDANDTYQQVLELNQSLDRINRGRISFEEFPVTFDNDFYFTLNVDDRVDVLEIRSEEAPENISKVYADENLFNFQSYPADNLDYNAINNSDLIILNEISSISPSLSESLLEFLNNSGTIVIIPSENITVESYRPLLAMRAKQDFANEVKSEFRTPDLSNPFFNNMFIDSDEVFEMPLGMSIIEAMIPSNALISLRNRNPFLSEIVGNKKIFLFSTPLNENFTTFHQHAIFVPVMYRIASLSNVLSDDLYYSLNQSIISLRVDTVTKNPIYKLKNENQELIPAQRIIGRDVIMELPKNILDAGYYSLMDNDNVFKLLSFNYNKSESVMNQYKRAELVNAFPGYDNINVYEGGESEDFTNELKEIHSGVPLWKYMLVIALITLLAEILIIRYL